MASSASPCACSMARAASSGSYSGPSVMTRATRTPSWPATAVCSMLGRRESPRPRLASRAWALAMARSPPLTATYTGLVLQILVGGGETAGARQGAARVLVHEQQVDAAREDPGVALPRFGEAVGRPRGGERGGAVDAWAPRGEPGRAGAAADVEHDRRGQVRRLVGAEGQGRERRQRARAGDDEAGLGPRVRGRRPGGEPRPGAALP